MYLQINHLSRSVDILMKLQIILLSQSNFERQILLYVPKEKRDLGELAFADGRKLEREELVASARGGFTCVTSFQFGPMLCPIGYGPHRPRMNRRMNLPPAAKSNVVKNSLLTRGIDRRAPCNQVLFTPHHVPAASTTGRNENAKKSRRRGAIRLLRPFPQCTKTVLTWLN